MTLLLAKIYLIFSVAMILMPIIAFAVMHVGAFLNKVFAETSFQMAIAQKGVQYIRSKNVFLLQEQVKTHNLCDISYVT